MMQVTVDEYSHFYSVNIRVDKDKDLTGLDVLQLAAKEIGREIVRKEASLRKQGFL